MVCGWRVYRRDECVLVSAIVQEGVTVYVQDVRMYVRLFRAAGCNRFRLHKRGLCVGSRRAWLHVGAFMSAIRSFDLLQSPVLSPWTLAALSWSAVTSGDGPVVDAACLDARGSFGFLASVAAVAVSMTGASK